MARRLLLLAALVGAALINVRGADDPSATLPGVMDLTPANFDSIVGGSRAVLLEFYAPWCGHCKSLTPVLKALGARVAADPRLARSVVVAKVNADEHRALGERLGVQGFPTLKWFPRGAAGAAAPRDYTGARTVDAFEAFINAELAAAAGDARVPALTPAARRLYLAADAAERAAAAAEIAAEAAKLAGGDDAAGAALYARYAGKAAAGGAEYVDKELARLRRLVAAGAQSAAKAEELARKVSVLAAFAEEPAPAAGGGGALDGLGGDGDGYGGDDDEGLADY